VPRVGYPSAGHCYSSWAGVTKVEMASLTIQVPKEYLDRLCALAATTGRSESSLAGEALAAYLGLQEWHVAAISAAVAEADAGATPVEHAAVVEWLKSWGTDGELPRPRRGSSGSRPHSMT
jgi:predicted transcriptional regulator